MRQARGKKIYIGFIKEGKREDGTVLEGFQRYKNEKMKIKKKRKRGKYRKMKQY